MKVLVVNGFIREAGGDAALLSVLLHQLATVFPHAEITVSSLEDQLARPAFEGFPNIGSSRRYGADERVPRYRRAARKLAVAAIGACWPTAPSFLDRLLPAEVRRELQSLRDADLVVSVGGGYLNGSASLSGDLAVLDMLMPLRYALRADKRVFCAPQSYGPFGTGRQRRAARGTLGRVDLLLAREAKSLEILQSCGIQATAVVQTIDSAFAFPAGDPTGWRSKLGVPDDQTVIGMTLRQWGTPLGQRQQEVALARLIDHIQSDLGRTVVLIPMVVSALAGEDDRETHRRVASRCVGRQPLQLEHYIGHRELKNLSASLDLMIGMRFHSVIFSITNLIPSIAIEYHHKASGIMADLGLEDWVLPFASLSAEQLIERFEGLLRESADYREHLKRTIPVAVGKAREVADIMARAYGVATSGRNTSA